MKSFWFNDFLYVQCGCGKTSRSTINIAMLGQKQINCQLSSNILLLNTLVLTRVLAEISLQTDIQIQS